MESNLYRKKVEAMHKIAEPKTRKELRRFIGMVNYYWDMWIRRSHVLALLTALTSLDAKFVWTDKERKAFNTMKQILSKETLLAYPDFSKHFEIDTDASKYSLAQSYHRMANQLHSTHAI